MCCGSCFSVNKANDKSAGAKTICAHCAVSLVRVSSAKSVCAKCAVAVVSVSTKPTTRTLEPKLSVPTVPCRWCVFPVPKVYVPNVLWQLFQCQSVVLAPTIYMAASAMKDQSTYVAATTQTMRTVGRRTLHKYSTYCTQTSWLSA